jgi:outer membrane protein assembly factor BamE (lipoprotein component of BamABCDE complex)
MRTGILVIISFILLFAACTTGTLQAVSTYQFENGNIEVGMDINEVRSIAGPPETIDKSTFFHQKQRWYYHQKQRWYHLSQTGRVMITFFEGVAVEIHTWR